MKIFIVIIAIFTSAAVIIAPFFRPTPRRRFEFSNHGTE